MRPQRSAAVAAKAAITALSESISETNEESASTNANEDVDFTPSGQQLLTFNRTKEIAQTSADGSSKSKSKKRKRQDEEEEYATLDEPAKLVENPSLLDKLPTELRMKILTQLDGDIYTIVSCLLVSKTFLSSMSIHRDPEKDWERRCRRMGALKRSPGCKSWRETYFQIARRRCARCFTATTAKLGLLLETGPSFIVVCEACQFRPGRYQIISSSNAESTWPVTRGHVQQLKSKWRKVDNRYWVVDYLRSSVLKLSRRLERARAREAARAAAQK